MSNEAGHPGAKPARHGWPWSSRPRSPGIKSPPWAIRPYSALSTRGVVIVPGDATVAADVDKVVAGQDAILSLLAPEKLCPGMSLRRGPDTSSRP